MSSPINPKINPYPQVSTGMNTPQIPGVNTDEVAQGIAQNSVLKGVSNSSEQDEAKNMLITAGLTIPVGIGMIAAMDKFNEGCGNGLLNKVADFGEKIDNTAFFKSKAVKSVGGFLGNVKKNFFEKIVPKVSILNAFFNTPALPKNKMVLMMYSGTGAEVSSNAIDMIEKHLQHGGTLKGVDVTEAELKALKEKVHMPKTQQRIIEICEKQGNDILQHGGKFASLKKIPLIGKWMPEGKYLSDFIPFVDRAARKNVKFAEFSNKIKACNTAQAVVNGKTGFFGKNLPKAMLRVIEGLTNGTAGGKLAVMMGAFFVADAIKKTMDAPSGKGEKGKTFAENLIYNVGWYITMPLGLGLMYKTGGLKYTGLSKEQVDNYRKELEIFNNKAKDGLFANKQEYDAARTSIKNMLKVQPKDAKAGSQVAHFFKEIIRKPLRGAAKILTVGLETIRPFKNNNASALEKIGESFANAGYKFKCGAGYPMRFIPFMFMVAPFLGELAAKGSHILFGRPTKSVLDEAKEPETEKPRQIISPVTSQQSIATTNTVQPVRQMQPMQPIQEAQALAYAQSVPKQDVVARDVVSKPIAQEKMIPTEEPKRRYIPSEAPVKIDMTEYRMKQEKIAAAEAKLDKAEAKAKKFVNE